MWNNMKWNQNHVHPHNTHIPKILLLCTKSSSCLSIWTLARISQRDVKFSLHTHTHSKCIQISDAFNVPFMLFSCSVDSGLDIDVSCSFSWILILVSSAYCTGYEYDSENDKKKPRWVWLCLNQQRSSFFARVWYKRSFIIIGRAGRINSAELLMWKNRRYLVDLFYKSIDQCWITWQYVIVIEVINGKIIKIGFSYLAAHSVQPWCNGVARYQPISWTICYYNHSFRTSVFIAERCDETFSFQSYCIWSENV